MLIWASWKRQKARIEPLLSAWDFALWGLLGLGFGVVMTFRWAAFHWPLVAFVVLSFVGSMVVTFYEKGSYRKVE